jgi:hypothetical protein
MSGEHKQRGDYDEEKGENAPPKRSGSGIRRRGGFAAILPHDAVDAAKSERKTARWGRKRRRRAQQRYD